MKTNNSEYFVLYLVPAYLDERTRTKKRTVDGKVYSFNYEGLELFAHRDMYKESRWRVTIKEIGMSIVRDCKTKKEAIAKAKAKVHAFGIEAIKKEIQYYKTKYAYLLD